MFSEDYGRLLNNSNNTQAILKDKANKVNVYHYLNFLFERQTNERMTDEELDQLAPWNEEVKEEIQRRVGSQNNEQLTLMVKPYMNCQCASVG